MWYCSAEDGWVVQGGSAAELFGIATEKGRTISSPGILTSQNSTFRICPNSPIAVGSYKEMPLWDNCVGQVFYTQHPGAYCIGNFKDGERSGEGFCLAGGRLGMSDASEEDGVWSANALVEERKTQFSDIPVPAWPGSQ